MFPPQHVLGWARGAAAQTLVPVQCCRGGKAASVTSWAGTTPQDHGTEKPVLLERAEMLYIELYGILFQRMNQKQLKTQ